MDLYIYGIGRDGRAVCSLLLSNGRMEHQWCKVFDGAMPTKSGPLPLLPGGRCWYQAMLYALAWGEPVENFRSLLLNFNYAAGHLWFVYMLVGIYLLMPMLSPWAERVGKRRHTRQ